MLPSGGHTGGASGAVHQGPRPLEAHQRGLDSNLKKINIKLFPTLSIVDAQLCNASSGTQQIEQLFLCPLIGWLIKFLFVFIYQSAASLVATYINGLSDSFTTQLLSYRALFKDDIKQIPTVMELAHFLVVKNYSLLPTFQDLYTAFLLFLTLPVTVATAERSFLN